MVMMILSGKVPTLIVVNKHHWDLIGGYVQAADAPLCRVLLIKHST